MRKKIALAGIGKIAHDEHVPALAASPDWELAATVSRHGSVEGVPSYRTLSDMLADRPDIDTVSLCMPPVPRFGFAAEAIRAGRNVMLEKPPGATVAECRTLAALAREAGVSIYATWHSREAAQVAPLRAWLRGKQLENLKITWKEDVRRWHPGQAWIWEPGGLGVFDPGINALSILTEILPERVHLRSAELSFPANCDTPIAAMLEFVHPHGAAVSAVFDFRQEGEQTWSIAIETQDGNALLTDGGANLVIDGKPKPSVDADGNPLAGEYPRLYANMARLVRDGESDMDLSPLIHVADAFLLGRRITVEPFHE